MLTAYYWALMAYGWAELVIRFIKLVLAYDDLVVQLMVANDEPSVGTAIRHKATKARSRQSLREGENRLPLAR